MLSVHEFKINFNLKNPTNSGLDHCPKDAVTEVTTAQTTQWTHLDVNRHTHTHTHTHTHAHTHKTTGRWGSGWRSRFRVNAPPSDEPFEAQEAFCCPWARVFPRRRLCLSRKARHTASAGVEGLSPSAVEQLLRYFYLSFIITWLVFLILQILFHLLHLFHEFIRTFTCKYQHKHTIMTDCIHQLKCKVVDMMWTKYKSNSYFHKTCERSFYFYLK